MDTPLPDSQALPQGTQLHEFVIERVLGSGGFGITYLARDTSLGRQVVIKENLPAQYCFRDTRSLTVAPRHTHGDDADNFQWSLSNFSKEAAMLASLDHQGIVKVLRSFEAFGTAYFVMPFVEGVPFDVLINSRHGKDNPFSEEELQGVLERMLKALGYLHDRGVYHRDIKPANILITTEGTPTLIDFGSARQRLGERSLTVIESLGYTPFEQLQTRGNIGPWSDLYALGATLVKAITFETVPKAADRIMDDPWRGLLANDKIARHYSPGFLRSIERALAPLPDQRWQDAGLWQEASYSDLDTAQEMPRAEFAPTSIRADSDHAFEPLAEADNPLAAHAKPTRKVSKNTRKSLIAGACGLAVLGVVFLIIKNPGDEKITEEEKTQKEEIVEISAAQAEPSKWLKMAEAGDSHAQALLGDALYWGGMRGKGIEKDKDEGKRWILASAEAKHPLGLYLSGSIRPYGEKEAKEQAHADAIERGFLRDVENGGTAWWNAVASHLAKDSENADSLKSSLEWYRKAAEAGNAEGMTNLGLFYFDGTGVAKDEAEAVKWFSKAAEAGDALGMNNLGTFYMDGTGVAKDEAEGFEWYAKAADAGEALGMTNLGICYEQGTGVDKDEAVAVKWYRKAAEAGDALGMSNLGSCYANGTGIPKDEAEAVKWYRKAAEAGNSEGMFYLGECYANGAGISKDEREAVKWFRMAAEAGNADGMINLGVCYDKGSGLAKDESEAVKWFRMAAENEHPLGMNNLGLYYFNGTGVSKDENEAVKWFRMAAEAGEAEGMHNLGFCYAKGTGVTKDEKEAVKWYRMAAEAGLPVVMVNLGICYANGTGVTKDELEAVKWYRMAAEAGDAAGMIKLGRCYDNGDGVTKDEREAVKWYRMAAEAGDALGMNNLGVCYAKGNGVTKDLREAVKWFRMAADKGNSLGMSNFGRCHANGDGVTKDEHEAVKWYRMAAEAGDAEGMYNLGWCYANGTGGMPKNELQAVKWYQKAANQDHADSMVKLGICFENGTGVSKDESEAVKWYRMAAEAGHAQGMYRLGWCYDYGTGVTKNELEAVKWYRLAINSEDEQVANLAHEALKRLGK